MKTAIFKKNPTEVPIQQCYDVLQESKHRRKKSDSK